MISGDRMAVQGKRGAFWYTLDEFKTHWDRIDVLCPRMPKNQRAKSNPLTEINFPELPNVFFHPSPYSLLRQPWWVAKEGEKLINEHGHSVLTVHEYPPFYNGMGAMKLHEKSNIPFALELHHLVGFPSPSSISERIGRIISRWVLPGEARSATAIRTVNNSVKSTLVDWGVSEERIHTVPSFYLDSESSKKFSDTEKDVDVVFVGRLVANKKLDRLLAAVASLSGVSLIVLGDGPQRKHYERISKSLKIEDRVTFAGWLPTRDDVIKQMQRARMLVMVSASEGGPRVVLEAMACGLPVIATPVGVMPEVIVNGENGLMTTGEPADIAEKIALLLSDNVWRERMGQNATDIRDKFDKKILVANYASFLQSLSASSDNSSSQ